MMTDGVSGRCVMILYDVCECVIDCERGCIHACGHRRSNAVNLVSSNSMWLATVLM